MSTNIMKRSAVAALLAATGVWAQNVNFQIVPLGGTIVNPGRNPTVLIQPGVSLPYEVIVAAVSNQTFPTTAGLAGFNFNVLTDFGQPQTSPFTFTPAISPLFSVNQALGTPFTDDIIGIAGAQNLAAPSAITTGFALNDQQTLGTGQLLTPAFEGTFVVNLVGSADLFGLGTVGTPQTLPGIVGPSPQITVITRFPDSTTPLTPPAPDPTPGPTPDPMPVIPGGSAGPEGPPLPDEQVAGDPATGPPLAGPVAPGLCGLLSASTLALTLLGLGLMRRTPGVRR